MTWNVSPVLEYRSCPSYPHFFSLLFYDCHGLASWHLQRPAGSWKATAGHRHLVYSVIERSNSTCVYIYSTYSPVNTQLKVLTELKSHLWCKHQQSLKTTQLHTAVLLFQFSKDLLTNCFDFPPVGPLFSANLVQCYY